MSEFTHITTRLSGAAIADLAPDFASLQPSQYKDGSYRLRRYSVFTFDRASRTVKPSPHTRFVQGSEVNHFQGDVPRDYPDLLPSTWKSPGFTEMVATFADLAELPEFCTVGIHQMRVVSKSPDDVALTTPEGVHQDGYDRIGMVTVGRTNTEGGELFLHPGEASEPVLATHPQPGDALVVNDRALWHSGSPLTARTADGPAYWDLFVLTANRS